MEFKDIEQLAELMKKAELTEISWKKANEEILLKKEKEQRDVPHFAFPPPMGMPPPPMGTHSLGAAPGQASAQSKSSGDFISSPIVGTFYRAASPDAEPFCKEGSKVKKGQVLCILEAMKAMNQFEAEFDCEIIAVLPKNGSPVEFGAPLFEVKRV